jgi:FMN phosphatase YigB (HAD superfamily)
MQEDSMLIFDLDETLSIGEKFYREVYHKTLEKVIERQRGKKGLVTLDQCRKMYDGRGELALHALDIPFWDWAKELIEASTKTIELIEPQPRLCQMVKQLPHKKVVYTGSPLKMAILLLKRLGFNPKKDFDMIIGWEQPESFPTKWTKSPLIFKYILERFKIKPSTAYAVGNVWVSDLKPAKYLGMKTVLIGNKQEQSGNPNLKYPSVEEFLRQEFPCLKDC